MAVVTSNVTPTTRQRFEVVETVAITDAAATATVTRALQVPSWARAFTCLLDLTITGTTPLWDFTIDGGTTAAGRFGALLDSTLDKFIFTGTAMTITQLTTDASTPIVAIDCGPGVTIDTTGSATANSSYAWNCTGLPPWLIYTYIYDGTTHDEDYNGTISFIWHPFNTK
jgi:hypothetical protein